MRVECYEKKSTMILEGLGRIVLSFTDIFGKLEKNGGFLLVDGFTYHTILKFNK